MDTIGFGAYAKIVGKDLPQNCDIFGNIQQHRLPADNGTWLAVTDTMQL